MNTRFNEKLLNSVQSFNRLSALDLQHIKSSMGAVRVTTYIFFPITVHITSLYKLGLSTKSKV